MMQRNESVRYALKKLTVEQRVWKGTIIDATVATNFEEARRKGWIHGVLDASGELVYQFPTGLHTWYLYPPVND